MEPPRFLHGKRRPGDHARLMAKNRIRGPLVTLAAVAALGGGLWLMNVSQETADGPPAKPVAQSTVTAAPVPPPPPPAPSTPPPVAVPGEGRLRRQDPDGDGPHHPGDLGQRCQGHRLRLRRKPVEVWLRGRATNGAVSLASKDKASRLEGKLQGNTIVGSCGSVRSSGTSPPPLSSLPPASTSTRQRRAQQLDRRPERRGHRCAAAGRRLDGPAAALSLDGTSCSTARP